MNSITPPSDVGPAVCQVSLGTAEHEEGKQVLLSWAALRVAMGTMSRKSHTQKWLQVGELKGESERPMVPPGELELWV